MHNFYHMPKEVILAVSMISAAGVVIQSIALIVCINRHYGGRVQRTENISEGAILLHIFLLSLLIAKVQTNLRNDLILPSGNIFARYMVFFVVFITASVMCRTKRTWVPMISVLVGMLTLPAVEKMWGDNFPAIYVFCLVYFMSRSIYMVAVKLRELKTCISELSVKEAMDALHTGILFCEPDGRIILINRQMQKLMISLTGMVVRNGREFLQEISGKTLRESGEFDGRMVFQWEDESVWMGTDTLLQMGTKNYHQITAADVTEKWNAIALLRQQNSELDQRGEELKQTIANLRSIYSKEEALRAKSRIHDILGQRIALLIRSLRENDRPDEALLKTFIEDWPIGFADFRNEHDAERSLEAMMEMIGGIGVEINMSGCLPENAELAAAFTDIISEAVTNAIRHGFAKEIDISCEKEEFMWKV